LLNTTERVLDCRIEYQPGGNINPPIAVESGVTQQKSGSFSEIHGKEKPTLSWAIFCAMGS